MSATEQVVGGTVNDRCVVLCLLCWSWQLRWCPSALTQPARERLGQSDWHASLLRMRSLESSLSQPWQFWLFIFLATNESSSGKAGKPLCGATKRSIADSEESEAYKSLFTTHSSAKRSKEESAHWVTHTSYCFWSPQCHSSCPRRLFSFHVGRSLCTSECTAVCSL